MGTIFRLRKPALWLAIFCLGSLAGVTISQRAQPEKPKYKWLVAHTPENQRLVGHAQDFANNMRRRTNGRVTLELVYPPQKQADGNNFEWATRELAKNTFQVSQIGVGALASEAPLLEVFDLPYLFSSHEHAAAVFDGPVGKEIRQVAAAESKSIRPLAFTYSGGYRMMVTNSSVANADDLKGRSAIAYIRKLKGDLYIQDDAETVRTATIKALGLTPVPATLGVVSELDNFRANDISYSEDHYSHYTRLFNKYGIVPGKMRHFLETRHNLFLTAITANEQFYQSLTEHDRAVLEEEAFTLAVKERADSIFVDQVAKRWLIASGYEVRIPSKELTAQLKQKTQVVYSSFKDRFQGFQEKIRAQTTLENGASVLVGESR